MPKFKYTAADSAGNEKNGIIDAVNRPAAHLRLKEMGLTPSSVTDFSQPAAKAAAAPAALKASEQTLNVSFSLPRLFSRGLNRKQLMIFTRQLATMIDAGVPLLRALQIIQKQEKSGVVKRITGELCEAVEGGSTLAEALAQHQKTFDKLFINMVKAGEIGGVLQIVLGRLAEFIEKADKIRTKIKSAMTYPIVVLIIAFAILGFLLMKIVPKFTEIFRDLLAGRELPLLTQFVVTASNVLVQRAPLVLIVLVGFIIAVNLIGRTKPGRHWFDVAKLKMPVIGPLVLRVGISRFTRTLGTLLNSGVQILQALTIVRDTAGNEVIARAVQSVHDSIKEGESVAAPLELSGVFPTMVVSMIAVGEETGRLPEMLVKIADTYDTEVDAAVEGLTSIIEPILIIFLAIVVGTIVIAMFMPMISIIQNLGRT